MDETQADTVRMCFRAFLEESTLSAAAKWLNLQGFKLRRDKQGGGHRPRLGHFTVENLYRILTNKAYIGIRTYPVKGQDERGEVPGNWDALVDSETFEKAGKLLKENCSRRKPESEHRYPFLLSRKVSYGTCHARMVGKSAHGNSGKVPYYEHGWATKRDGCLVKPAFDCAPFRVQAKLLEPAVWEEVLKLFRDPTLSKALIIQAKRAADERLGDSGQKRTETRISTVTQQIEVLAERLAELPKSISAAPIYSQMEKLQAVKAEEEARLRGLRSEQKIHDLPAELTPYEALLRGLHQLKDESTRTKIIEALIHEVEITPEGFRLHYYVGKNHVEGELARRASSGPSDFRLSRGSNSLTNGGRYRD